MLRGEFDAAGAASPAALRTAYAEVLRETVEDVGVDTVVSRSGVDRAVVEAVAAGEEPELTLEAAAAILATTGNRPPGDAVAAEARDILLMGMTSAVLDVDAVAAGVEGDLDAKEIQQKIEGRHPMTLTEYAQIHHFVAGEG